MTCSFPKCPHIDWPTPWPAEQPVVDYMEPRSPPHYCTRLHVPRRSLDFQYSSSSVAYREPSNRHVLAVLTAPRDPSTLHDTLKSLKLGGSSEWLGRKFIFGDGITPSVDCPDWALHRSDSPIGGGRSFIRVLQIALETEPDLEYLTLIEDDVLSTRNALSYVARTQIPSDVGLIAWFTYDYDYSFPGNRKQICPPASYGFPVLAVRSSRYFICTPACTYTRATIDRILSCPVTSKHWPKIHAHDELISWAVGDSLYAVHFPGLFQHRVGNSAITQAKKWLLSDPGNCQDGIRTSPFYMGDDFDALSLKEPRK